MFLSGKYFLIYLVAKYMAKVRRPVRVNDRKYAVISDAVNGPAIKRILKNVFYLMELSS